MTDEEVYHELIRTFKGDYLGRQWIIAPGDPIEVIKQTHGEAPLKQLRSLMILTGNHHLSRNPGEVGHRLWDPPRPAVGKKLIEEAFKLPCG